MFALKAVLTMSSKSTTTMTTTIVSSLSKTRTTSSSPSATFVRHCHLRWSPNQHISKAVYDRYAKLPLSDCKALVTYVWIDGHGEDVRSKTKTFDFSPTSAKECPTWDHDGSSTYLAETHQSDVLLHPVALYRDPTTGGANDKIVLCETYHADHKPTKTNYRQACLEALNCVCDTDPMFGLEQEYNMMDVNGRPFGWPWMLGEPAPAGPYYCGVGATKAPGREIVHAHYRACLYAGVDIGGINAEVLPSQWEFQTGPTLGIKAADDLWIGRYLLHRIAEDFGVGISLHPKLLPNWNGAGCHCNFSTKEMREEGGLTEIERCLEKLAKKHIEHIAVYDPWHGEGAKMRLTGRHETSSTVKFTSGVGDRSASVRINRRVADEKKGYLEDRRPCSNADPYQVINALVRTCLLDK